MLTVYVFLYGRLYLILSGLEKELCTERDLQNKPLKEALASQYILKKFNMDQFKTSTYTPEWFCPVKQCKKKKKKVNAVVFLFLFSSLIRRVNV